MIMRFGARFETVVGVDHSGLMLSEAKRLCSDEGIRPKLIESDLLEFIEEDDRTWDLITCVGCLHHLKVADVPLIISRLANRLVSHGQAVLSEPIVVDPGTEPEEIRKWNAESLRRSKGYRELVPEPDEAPIQLELLKRSFAEAGLTVVTEKRGWEVLPRNTPASWWDQLVIRRLQERYGSNGVVYAVLLQKS